MKRLLNLVIALFICANLFSQTAPSYSFRKPVTNGANSWKFFSVLSGVNAIVTVIGSKNATLDRIDDSTVYKNAWQPFIKITNSTNTNSDSSYLEFKIEFEKDNGTPASQNTLAMTVIDLDGSSSLREFVKASLPATSFNVTGSTITRWTDSRWLNVLSGTTNYSTIDTSNYSAMTQINYSTIKTFTIRVGVVGSISSGTVRQHSFYFKPFKQMVVALPVNLISFNASLENNNVELIWSTASEENLNRFEVSRSIDGLNFYPIGTVEAKTNSNEQVNYEFVDYTILTENSPVVYYRLKMIDQDGNYILSNISQIRTSAAGQSETISLYPNPTTEFVNINQTEATDITIADAFGKTLKTITDSETNGNSIRFDVRNLQNGIYFINILNIDGSTTSAKFIKR